MGDEEIDVEKMEELCSKFNEFKAFMETMKPRGEYYDTLRKRISKRSPKLETDEYKFEFRIISHETLFKYSFDEWYGIFKRTGLFPGIMHFLFYYTDKTVDEHTPIIVRISIFEHSGTIRGYVTSPDTGENISVAVQRFRDRFEAENIDPVEWILKLITRDMNVIWKDIYPNWEKTPKHVRSMHEFLDLAANFSVNPETAELYSKYEVK